MVAQIQMIRIHTKWIIAGVKHPIICGFRLRQLIRNPMRFLRVRVVSIPKRTVSSSICTTLPFPALIWVSVIYLTPKASFLFICVRRFCRGVVVSHGSVSSHAGRFPSPATNTTGIEPEIRPPAVFTADRYVQERCICTSAEYVLDRLLLDLTNRLLPVLELLLTVLKSCRPFERIHLALWPDALERREPESPTIAILL